METAFQRPEFAARFPCAVPQEKLHKMMEFYMDAVENMVSELQGMFPQSEP